MHVSIFINLGNLNSLKQMEKQPLPHLLTVLLGEKATADMVFVCKGFQA